MKQELFREEQKASSPAAATAAAAAAAASRSRAFRGRRESPRSDSANGPSPILKTRPKPPPPSEPPTSTTTTRIRSTSTTTTAAAAAAAAAATSSSAAAAATSSAAAAAATSSAATSSAAAAAASSAAAAAAAATSAAIHANKMRPSNDHDHRPAAAGRFAEQFAHQRPDAKELQRRRQEESEKVVRELRGEVTSLRAELKRLQDANSQLESENKRFADDLLAAQERIQHLQNLHLPNCQKLEQQKVEDDTNTNTNTNSDTDTDTDTDKTQLPQLEQRAQLPALAKHKNLNAKSSPAPPPPPPPPPPPMLRQAPPWKSNSVNKATALVELYNSLTKRDGKDSKGSGSYSNSVGANPHHSIVGELQNRSGHLLAIKADVKTKGEFIRHLIDRVRSAAYTNMDDVLAFVDWLDRELSTLSDERAVLKHFDWPERKADALREAAFEYRDLKRVEAEAASFSDDPSSPCEATLKKISNLLEKLEKSMNRLVKLRNSSVLSYKECKIPTEWMLDSGVVSTIKLASMKLAKVYMKRVVTELDTNRSPEWETAQEALLFQSVRFAYRAHQFAGGLDSETMRAFELLREKVRSNGRGSKVLIPGMVFS